MIERLVDWMTRAGEAWPTLPIHERFLWWLLTVLIGMTATLIFIGVVTAWTWPSR